VMRLSDLYGPTALAYGKSRDHFKLTSGLSFEVNSLWTATLVKEDNQWQVTSFHASTNLFDNPLLNAAKDLTVWVGVLAGLGGLVLGYVLARLLGRRRPAAETLA
jgi:ABC-type Fe3+ transport system permease subunit